MRFLKFYITMLGLPDSTVKRIRRIQWVRFTNNTVTLSAVLLFLHTVFTKELDIGHAALISVIMCVYFGLLYFNFRTNHKWCFKELSVNKYFIVPLSVDTHKTIDSDKLSAQDCESMITEFIAVHALFSQIECMWLNPESEFSTHVMFKLSDDLSLDKSYRDALLTILNDILTKRSIDVIVINKENNDTLYLFSIHTFMVGDDKTCFKIIGGSTYRNTLQNSFTKKAVELTIATRDRIYSDTEARSMIIDYT